MSEVIKRQHDIEQLERQRDHDFTLFGYQSDRLTPAALASGDVVRFKVWDSGDVDASPTLDLDSVALATGTFTADAGTDVVTASAHGLTNGQRVRLTSAGTLPAGLSAAIAYYVVNKTTNTFQVSLTSGGAAVDIDVYKRQISNATGSCTRWCGSARPKCKRSSRWSVSASRSPEPRN